MAKDAIDRAARAGADDVAGASKQQEVAALLKKMKIVDDGAEKDAHSAQDNSEAVASTDSAQTPAADAQQFAAADSVFASDASYEVASASAVPAAEAGSEGGISTGTMLAIGGVALVAGGIAIAANNDDDGGGKKAKVESVTAPAASANEGETVNFTVTGKPGATFTWELSGSAANANDVSSPLTGQVTLGADGTAIIPVAITADAEDEAAEELVLTVGGVASAPVSIGNVAQPAQDAQLTTDPDVLDYSGTSGANHIEGVANGFSILAPGTFTVGDKITGNGETVLDLKVGFGGPQPVVQLDNLAEINMVNAGAGAANFNASLWTNVGSVNLVDGADGFQVALTDVEQGTGLSISDLVAGTLMAEYTDQVVGGVMADHNSAISFLGGDVEATVANGQDAAFAYTYDKSPALDLTVGNIDAALGKSSEFSADVHSYGGAGTVTVGDIDVTGGKSNNVEIMVSAENSVSSNQHSVVVGNVGVALGDASDIDVDIVNDGSSNVENGDVTAGNIDLSAGANASVSLSVESSAEYSAAGDHVKVGNVSVGDVTLTGGKDADLYGSISNYANGNTAHGQAEAGNVTVGDISVTVGDDTTAGTAEADFYVYQFAYAFTGDKAAAGDVTVGDVTLAGGFNADVYASVENTADAHAAGATATVGNVTVGNIDMAIGQSGFVGFGVYNTASGESLATVGDSTIGNLALDVATSASATFWASLSADADAASNAQATVGNVTIGNVSGALGVNAAFDSEIDISADANGSAGGVATVGNVSVGSIDVELNDGAEFSVTVSVTATGGDVNTIGNVSFGDAAIYSTNGVSSEAYLYREIYADQGTIGNVDFGGITTVHGAEADVTVYNYATGATIGDVSFGDVEADANATNAFFYNYNSAQATNGDVGNVSIGDVSLSAGTSATASGTYYVYATTGDIGDVSIGNLSAVASGTSADANLYLYFSASSAPGFGGGDVGNVNIGDVVLSAVGPSAAASADINFLASHEMGSFTVGDLSLSVDANAVASVSETASVSFSLSTDYGSVTLGDVSLHVGAAQGANTGVDTNNIDFNVTAPNDVELGVISVSGGDGSAGGNVDTVNGAAADVFTNVLTGVVAGGDITIGGVDYSGYGAAATIDVSGYKGAATIIGSAFDDLITDNDGTNTITGGAGADEFHFLDTNTGKTEATADKITDFQYGVDHIGTGAGAIGVADYAEGTFADFASFLSNADGADKTIAAGQVGDNVFLAIDYNADNSVDYVIELVNSNLANVAVDSFI